MATNYVSLKNGQFDETTRADLDKLLDGLDSSGQKLVVHFHGGLVNKAAGMKTAARLQSIYEQPGGYPLFFVWQSGLCEAIVNNLGDIAGEKIFKRIVGKALQFAVGKVKEEATGTRGMTVELPALEDVYTTAFGDGAVEPYAELAPAAPAQLSASQEQQLIREMTGDAVIQTEAAKIANSLHEPTEESVGGTRGARVTGSTETAMSPDVLDEIRTEAGDEGERGLITTARIVKGAITTVRRVLARLQDGRAHGIYPTVVEELLRELYLTNAGGLVWNQMKKDTADAFQDDAGRYGGTALLDGLSKRQPAATPVLVGHSTGAVYICNLLAHADALLPAGRKFDVVLLAPACDFNLMDRTFVEHGDRIGRLRIFCMKDERERSDQLASVVYPRSLLYFVSGALEAEPDWPILGMQRFYSDGAPFGNGKFPEIKRVREAIAKKPDSEVWSLASDPGGLSSSAEHHGDFDNDDTTLESVKQFISED
jgi:hypothetical protein